MPFVFEPIEVEVSFFLEMVDFDWAIIYCRCIKWGVTILAFDCRRLFFWLYLAKMAVQEKELNDSQ
jgi:hypothetical protein